MLPPSRAGVIAGNVILVVVVLRLDVLQGRAEVSSPFATSILQVEPQDSSGCAQVDYPDVDKLQGHAEEFCQSSDKQPTPKGQSSARVTQFKPEASGCGEVTIFMEAKDVVLLGGKDNVTQLRFRCSGGISEEGQQFHHKDWPVELSATAESDEPQGGWITDNTFLVFKPRPEYFHNLFHNVEEVFGAFQTAKLVKSDLSTFQGLFVFSWRLPSEGGGVTGMFISHGTITMLGRVDESGWQRPLLDLWRHILADPSKAEGGPSSAERGPPAEVLRKIRKLGASSVGFRRLVVPMGPCRGSIMSESWNFNGHCPAGGSRLAKDVSAYVLRAFGIKPSAQAQAAGFLAPNAAAPGPVVTLIRRTGSRRLVNEEEVAQKIRELPQKPQVNVVDLGTLLFKQQLEVIQKTEVLVGVHGAGLTHALYLPSGKAVVELALDVPPLAMRSVANTFWNIASWAECRYVAVQAHGDFDGEVQADAQEVAEAVQTVLENVLK